MRANTVSTPDAGPYEAAESRFVRAAALEAGPHGSRLSVLMVDDRIGRIALRMVDRAGLIHAVVRSEDAAGAQALNEALPSLLESLSQKGMAASWHTGDEEGRAQPDGRQGQGRRGRPSGQPGRGRNVALPAFRLETA